MDKKILYEIVSHGMTSKEKSIHENAGTIVSLILKSRHLISNNWESIESIINPMIPLLQSLPPNEFVDQTLQDLMNPDLLFDESSKLKYFDVLCGNIRFLFSTNFSLRSEAIYRLAYMISSNDMRNEYIPNILEISDTIPNDICVVKNPKDRHSIFQGSSGYTKANVGSCIQILQTRGMEPVLKKTALMQLNIMCQNQELNAMINDVKAWYLPLKILQDSLKSSSLEYQDSAVPAVGIISKLLLTSREFRDILKNETNIYELLLRTLFLFHTDIALQFDASLAMFLLVFNEFISTGNDLILPKIFKNINCPIKFNTNNSEGENLSTYESAYFKLIRGAYTEIDCETVLQFLRISFNGLL